jgi:hypothetical protein
VPLFAAVMLGAMPCHAKPHVPCHRTPPQSSILADLASPLSQRKGGATAPTNPGGGTTLPSLGRTSLGSGASGGGKKRPGGLAKLDAVTKGTLEEASALAGIALAGDDRPSARIAIPGLPPPPRAAGEEEEQGEPSCCGPQARLRLS